MRCRTSVRRHIAGVTVTTLTAGLLVAVAEPAARAVTSTAHLTTIAAVDRGAVMAVNADGTKVAYTNANDAGDHEVYLYDAATGESTLLTSAGGDGTTSSNGDSIAVAISADGSYVAFVSSATDLDASGAAGAAVPQAYVAHISGGGSVSLTRLPVPPTATSGASSIAISADGSRVAFAGNAGATGTGSAYVDDWQGAGAMPRPVDVTPSNSSTRTVIDQVTLSADGSTLAAVVDDGTATVADGARVVLADLAGGATATMPGTEADRGTPVALTGTGDLVLAAPAFAAPSPQPANWTPPDYLLSWQWRQDGATAQQIGSNGHSVVGSPSISTDGHLVAYSLKYDDEHGSRVQLGAYPDVTWPEVDVSVDANNEAWPSTGSDTDPALARALPKISGDGLHVVFRSNASQLPGHADGKTTLYLATLDDSQSPTFESPAMSVDGVAPDSVDLSLPTADDDLFVVNNTLTDNGAPVGGYDGGSQYTVTGLTPGTKHVFTYTAADQSGHTASQTVTAWTGKAPVAGNFDTTLVSALPAGDTVDIGIHVDENAGGPVLSSDGRYVAFVGAAFAGYDSNGDPVDANGNVLTAGMQPDDQVYLTDTLTGATTLVTHQSGTATPADQPAPTSLAISADGRYVAYEAVGTDLAAGVSDTDPHAYVYDRVKDVSTEVPTQYQLAILGPGGGVMPSARTAAGGSGGSAQRGLTKAGTTTRPTLAVNSAGDDVSSGLALSADGSTLVALTIDPSSWNNAAYAESIDWQGSGHTTIPFDWSGFSAMALSADGNTLAVSGGTGDGPGLTVIDLATQQDLADFFQLAAMPVGFASDGTLLLDGSGPYGGPSLALEWKPAAPDQLVAFGGEEPGAFAADGVHVAQFGYDDNGYPVVYLESLPDGAPQRIDFGDEPTISGDGSAVAYVDEIDDANGWHLGVFLAHPHDANAPTWTAGDQLTVSDVTTTSAHLSWPAASDDTGVAAYVLTQDGKHLATVDANTRSFDVTGLSAGTSYSFTVVAKDAAGNGSQALSADATTLSAGVTPGDDPLLAKAAHGGLVTLSWDAASGSAAGGYRVMRDDGTGFVQVADVAAGTTSYTDTGLLASTRYTYRVDLLDGAGAPGPWTTATSLTTPDLAISKATATIPRVEGTDLAALGGRVQLHVIGEANRQADARIVYGLPDDGSGIPQSESVDIALTEDAANPGNYTGSWTIPEGAAVLDSVTGVLSDGVTAHDAALAAAGLPAQVSGAIAVTVDAPPAGSLAGSTLYVAGSPVAVDGPGTYTVPEPAGTGYRISMDTKTESAVATATADVVAGRTSTVEFTPSLHSSLVVTIAKADVGYYCSSYVSVTVIDDAGTQLGQQQTSCYQRTVTFSGLPVGDHVTATSTLLEASDPVRDTVDTSLTLVEGENDVTLTHDALPAATVSGTVTAANGTGTSYPLYRATVVATEHVDGRDWSYQTTTDGYGKYSLGVLAGQATVTVSYPGSAYFPQTDQLSVGGGDAVTHDVELKYGTLTVHVLSPDGVAAGGVTVSDSFGYGVDSTVDVPDGQTDATLTGVQNRKVTVTVDVRDRSKAVTLHYSQTVTPTGPDSELTIRETALPTGTLQGTVTAGGNPVPGMTVQLSENVDGRPWTFHGMTDSGGSYSIAALAGSGLAAPLAPTPNGYNLPAGHSVTVPAAGNATSDFQLPAFTTRTVHLHLITADFGSSPSPQTLDWTTNIHFSTSLHDASGRSYSVGDTAVIPTSAASPLTFCASGLQAGLSRGCVTQSFDDSQFDIPMTLQLTQVAGVTGTVLGPDGSPFTGTWSVSAQPLDDTARNDGSSFTAFGDSSSLHQGLPAAGKWQIYLNSSKGRSTPVQVTVQAGQSIDLGDLLLSGNSVVSQAATSVVATPNPVEPGQLLQVRAAFTTSTSLPGASIRLGIPAGTAFAANSVTVDGTPVDASAADGAVTVPLGDLPGGASHLVRYTVTVNQNTHAPSLSAPVWLVDTGGTLHAVGSATVPLISVSLNAPEHATADTFTVNGTAPAGNDVTVVDAQGNTVGTASAGPGGLWQAQVQLSDPYSGRTYQLTAQTDYDGQTLTDTADVAYDPGYLLPTTITVGQPDGRFHSYNPADGIAYFTLVYRPALPVRVIAKFADTARVENPIAWVGTNWAPMTCDSTNCTADVRIADEFAGGAGVAVDYHVKPVLEPGPAPTQQQVMAAQPGPFADAYGTSSSTSYAYASDQSGSPAGESAIDSETSTGTIAVPGSGVDMNYDVSIAESDQPVGDPVDMSGGTLYASHTESKSADGSVSLGLTLFVPADEIAAANGSVRTALRTLGMSRLAAVTPDSTVSKALGVVVNVGLSLLQGAEGAITGAAQTAWGLVSAFYTPPSKYYNQLNDLQVQVMGADCLSPAQKDLLLAEIETAGVQETLLYAMQALAPVPLFLSGIGEESGAFFTTLKITSEQVGKGLVNYLAGNLVTDLINMWMQAEVDDTRADIDKVLQDSGCHQPPCPPASACPAPKPSGNITPIIDPSGVVTDATTGDPIDGVTATIQTAPTKDGPWTTWNAADYGQTNPQVTDSTGAFGWDTPIGWYRVQFTKDRYLTGYTQVVHVLPEWTGLNVALQRKVVQLGVSVQPAHPVYGKPFTLTVSTTPSEPGQVVSVSDGDVPSGSAVIGGDGTAAIEVSGLHAGTHTLTVSYPGDAEHFPSSAAVPVTVARAATRLTVDRVRTLGDLLRFLSTRQVSAHLVRADDGSGVAGAQVTVSTRTGFICTATTDASGTVTCTVPVRMIAWVLLGEVQASFAGTADYRPATYGSGHGSGHGSGQGGRGRPGPR